MKNPIVWRVAVPVLVIASSWWLCDDWMLVGGIVLQALGTALILVHIVRVANMAGWKRPSEQLMNWFRRTFRVGKDDERFVEGALELPSLVLDARLVSEPPPGASLEDRFRLLERAKRQIFEELDEAVKSVSEHIDKLRGELRTETSERGRIVREIHKSSEAIAQAAEVELVAVAWLLIGLLLTSLHALWG